MSFGRFRQYTCGCSYYVNRREQLFLPQVQLEAHTTVLAHTSRTVLKQTFSNPSSENIKQCTYMFPLYDGVSVVAFTCRVGSRVLRGVVKERGKAKATFDAAVSRGESAGLFEQLPEASDCFSTRLGNIPANEKVYVEISYVGELKHDAEADGIRFTIPTRIAPRYGALSSTQAGEGSSVQETGGIGFTVDAEVAEGSFIRGIQSPTHPIAVTMGNTSTSAHEDPVMHRASATLSLKTTELDKDFVLIVLTKETGTPKALLESHATIPNQKALMLTLVPRFSLPRIDLEVVFVADRSGSMQGNVATLVSALKVFLKSLPLGVRFNICSFGSNHSFLWPKSQAYSRDSVNEALAHVETFAANYGGTETFAALQATIENRFTDIPCEVMLLTDGDIWHQNDLFTYLNNEVQKSKPELRIFALGIGDGVSHALIEGVARAGNGFAQTVNNNEKLDSKVIRMLKGGLSPHTFDYDLEVKYEDVDEDFEIVDRVADSLRVILGEGKPNDNAAEKQENTPISFFSHSSAPSGQEKPPSAENDTTDPFAHLPAISVPKIIQTPQTIPSLFPFSRTSVYLLFSGESAQKTPKSITLRARSDHGPLELEIPVEVLKTPGETVHQLAARKAILELEEGRGWIYEAKDKNHQQSLIKDMYPSRFDEMVQREGVRIGLQYQVGGKWCSFVAVKDNNNMGDMPGLQGSKNKGRESPILQESDDKGRESALEFEVDESSSGSDMGFGAFDDSIPAYQSKPSARASGRSFGGSTFGAMKAAAAPAGPQLFGAPNHSYLAMSGFGNASVDAAAASPTPQSYFAANRGYQKASAMPLSADARFISTRSAQPPTQHSQEPAAMGGVRSRRGGLMSMGAQAPPARQNNSVDAMQCPQMSWSGSKNTWASTDSMATESYSTPQTDNEKVHAIIGLQDFEGWWEKSQELDGLLSHVRVDKESNGREWTTMLVVKWLEEIMGRENEVWELVVEKARSWLQGKLPDKESLERLEKEVMNFIMGF
ncbi:MAG: hypothetical protein Q9219_004132 [cf. Caloplaca sp. 3 TL-2023]